MINKLKKINEFLIDIFKGELKKILVVKTF